MFWLTSICLTVSKLLLLNFGCRRKGTAFVGNSSSSYLVARNVDGYLKDLSPFEPIVYVFVIFQ